MREHLGTYSTTHQPIIFRDKIPFYFGISVTCLFGGLLGTVLVYSCRAITLLYIYKFSFFEPYLFCLCIFERTAARTQSRSLWQRCLSQYYIQSSLIGCFITGIIAESFTFTIRTRYFKVSI